MRGFLRGISVSLLIFLCPYLFAQENDDLQAAEGDEVLPASSGSLIDPVFPDRNTALLQFEAEDAVSTNFATAATLNYGASGYRTLQLNRYTGLFGDAAFYAEYVFFVDEPGVYELWYGGTPPGPEDEVFPSYGSPFSYSIDQGEMVDVHREQVNVVERYAPNYYWVKFGTAKLESGVHRLRVDVDEKRKYDGKFLFNLDSFLLIDSTRFDRTAGIPRVFPRDLDDRSIDVPMKTINDFTYLISVEPDNVENYTEFSLVYAVIGDYLNALRNVNKALLLDPDNAEARLLAAKYRLWKGEADESLKMYRLLVDIQPDMREVWAEAGKVAAWVGRYDESLDYYAQALEYFPDDLNLSVNRAITYLWASKEREAQLIFDEVETAAAGNVDLALELGEILVANGYPDKAVTLYARSIERNPEFVDLYLKLVQAYAVAGQAEKSETVQEQIRERFLPSARLDALLESFSIEEGMKEQVIRGFTDALSENPDNLSLRTQLVQTYFWNGLRKKAIEESLNILVNHAYISLSDFDRRSGDLLELTDFLSVFRRRFADVPSEIEARHSELEFALDIYQSALKNFEKYDAKARKAKDAGNPPPAVDGVHPNVALSDAQAVLADTTALATGYLRWIAGFIQRSEELLEQRNVIAVEEQATRDSFVRLTAASGWRWDRQQMIEELNRVSDSGFFLADYVLGRIYNLGGQYATAGPLLSAASAAGDAAASYAVMQNSLWSGDPAGSTDAAASVEYASYLEPLAALVKELGLAQIPLGGIFTDATLSDMQDVFTGLDRLEDEVALHTQAIDGTLSVLKGVARSRLERIIYEHRQDTYLLRFELGDYYLQEGDYAESVEQGRSSYADAAEQLGYVLDIDPFNTSAVYKLGILYDRLGNWSRAMESYSDVYEADPRFENVAAYYNQLARRHADISDFDLQLTADASRIAQKSSLSLGNEFNSAIGLRTNATSETVRMYRDLDVEGAGEPWQYQVHELSMSVPLTITGIGLTIKPVAGIKISSELLYGPDGITDLIQALNPAVVIGSYGVEPELGGDLYLATDYLSVSGIYRYGRFDESYQPGAERLITHSAAASAKLNFSIFNQDLLEYSSARVGGDVDLLSDSSGSINTLFGVNERLDFVFHLADSPWTNLTIFQLLDYQSSEEPGASEYFAPNNMLQINGGIGIATWLNVNNDTTFGIIFNVSPGVLMPGSTGGEPAAMQIQVGADLRVELNVADVTYYAAAGVSGSAETLPGLDYWSSSVNFGVTARLPRLLAE
jgi:tetratricopeptide (TPR) repeat protein